MMAGGVAIRTIHDYVGAVSLAVDNSEGHLLASLLSVYNASHAAVVSLGLDVIRVSPTLSSSENGLDEYDQAECSLLV